LVPQIQLKEQGKIAFFFTQVTSSFVSNIPVAWPAEVQWISTVFANITLSFNYAWWYCRYWTHTRHPRITTGLFHSNSPCQANHLTHACVATNPCAPPTYWMPVYDFCSNGIATYLDVLFFVVFTVSVLLLTCFICKHLARFFLNGVATERTLDRFGFLCDK
jgi:hypothetical protein